MNRCVTQGPRGWRTNTGKKPLPFALKDTQPGGGAAVTFETADTKGTRKRRPGPLRPRTGTACYAAANPEPAPPGKSKALN